MNYEDMTKIMESQFDEVRALRDAGQKEYAHDDANVFANFHRVASALGMPPERVLLVYLLKHLDGISAWAKGHRSQREDIRGRIGDAITYLCLFRAMVEEDAIPVAEPLGRVASLHRNVDAFVDAQRKGDTK